MSKRQLWSALLSLLPWCFSAAVAQSSRIMEVAELTTAAAHVDLNVQFNCQVRYVTHAPATEGSELRMRLTLDPDCARAGAMSASESLASPDPTVVSAIEMTPLLGGDVELLIRWRRAEQFAVAPTAQQRALRIRLLRADAGAKQAQVLISEPDTAVLTGYAINLDSSLAPFDPEKLAAAEQAFGIHAYQSEFTVDDTRWYRLRIGPILARPDAQRVLLQAQKKYPRAWLAIADEIVENKDLNALPESDSVESTAQEIAVNAGIKDAEADALWSAAREHLRQKDYDAAIEELTKLLQRASRKHRMEAQELLGLARERHGQLAHAKAEYEAYLREFPNSSHSNRVRRRLSALRTATLPGRGATGGRAEDAEGTWNIYGGFSQFYRRDDSRISVDAATEDFVGQNALLNDVDVVARRRGFDFDMRARLSAGFMKDFLSDGPGDQVRVSSAFVELADRDRNWFAALGRQSRTSGGLLGAFDGVLGSYQFHPHFIVDAAAGFPVETSRRGVDTHRLFESLAVNFGAWADAWEPTIYVVNQTLDGAADRQAVGTEVRYFRPGRVVIGFVDYDVHFQALNSAVLIGTLQLPGRWTLNIDAERRKTPLISTRNALIGQPITGFSDLHSLFTDNEIQQLALDRTPDTDIYGLSISRPIGERLRFTLAAQSVKTGSTQPSGGIEGIPGVGPELIAGVQLLAASLLRSGDINLIDLRRQSGGAIETTSLGISSRIPVWNSWRIGPQIRAERRVPAEQSDIQWLYAAGLRVSFQRRRLQAEFESGAEFSNQDTSTVRQSGRRSYFSLGYRWYFE